MIKNSGIILIFGLTGDLSKRKLIPGLYCLLKAGKLDSMRMVGAAIDSKNISEILDQAKPFIHDLDPVLWHKLVDKFSYCRVDINVTADFIKLADLIQNERDKYQLQDQTLIYCAVFEALYVPLTSQLAHAGIIRRLESKKNSTSWVRVVYEKPFGHSYESVCELNRFILNFLNENQIYRVDHYLAKEIVGNIAFLRFANRIFESLWDHKNIDSVYITLDEELDIEGRGAYYEQYGVIRDIVQNHILQLVALIAMDTPKSLVGNDIQDAKSAILKKIKCVDGILGQYKGYLDEPYVDSTSQMPTFAELYLTIDDYRWAGVPFYVRTGKTMPAKKTNIVIKFKDTHCLLPKNCPTDSSNLLTISIYPSGGFDLEVNAKKPGVNDEILPIKISSCQGCLFVPQAPEAYENVINEIMAGDTVFAVRMDEIESSWKISDQIQSLNLPLYQYLRGTAGPTELVQFNQKYKMIWK